jgi:methionyl-tRNA formyltransferase
MQKMFEIPPNIEADGLTKVGAKLKKMLPVLILYEVAKKLGIRTVAKQSDLKSTGVDLVISYMCRSLVRRDTLDRGKYALNFHAGPLPEFGGWAFYNVAILEESPEYGCTCHIMDDGFDTGPLVKVRRFDINPRMETALSLEKKAQTEMILLFREVISAYEVNGKIDAREQDAERMRYLNANQFKQLKEIPPYSTPEDVDKIARAFWYPRYEMAYYRLPNGTKLEVIPEVAKNEAAKNLHFSDLDDLLRVSGLTAIDYHLSVPSTHPATND